MASKVKAGSAWVELSLNDKLSRSLNTAGKNLSNFGAGVAKVGLSVGAAGAGIVGAFAGTAALFAKTGDEIAKMSKRTGVAVETLSTLSFVATQSGSNFETLELAFRKMQKSIYDGNRGVVTFTDAFEELGLNLEEVNKLSPEEQFKKFADLLGSIQDPTKKAGLAMTIFGRTGTNLIPMFDTLSAGIEATQKRAKDFGLVISNNDTKAAEELTDALDLATRSLMRIGFAVGAAVSGPFKELLEGLSLVGSRIIKWVDGNRELVQSFLFVGIGIAAVGGVITAIGGSLVVLGASFSIASIAVTALGSAFAAITAPIALFSIAVASVGAIILTQTKIGSDAIYLLTDSFKSLLAVASRVLGGIRNALIGGDIRLAAKVLWTGIYSEFLNGIENIRAAFDLLVLYGSNVWDKIAFGALTSLDYLTTGVKNVVGGIAQIFLGLGKLINKVFVGAIGGIIDGMAFLLRQISKVGFAVGIVSNDAAGKIEASIINLTGYKPDANAGNKFYDDMIKGFDQDKKDRELEFKARQAVRAKELKEGTTLNSDAFRKDREAADLAQKAAQEEYSAALAQSKAIADKAASDATAREAGKNAIPEIDAGGISSKITSALGSFSAASISQAFGAKSGKDKTADNTGKLVEEAKKTNELLAAQKQLAFR